MNNILASKSETAGGAHLLIADSILIVQFVRSFENIGLTILFPADSRLHAIYILLVFHVVIDYYFLLRSKIDFLLIRNVHFDQYE